MLASGMMAVTPMMGEDTVKLTTSKAVGETVSFELNQPKQDVIVDWGDGVKTTVAKTDASHLVVSGKVKGKVITVTSQSQITLLLCAGNDLTAIDLAAAPNLLSLYCQNNALGTLDVSPCKKLVDLNCSNNKLQTINITSTTNPNLENINVADNQLSTISSTDRAFAMSNDNLQHVDISNNKFTMVKLTNRDAKLDGLKASNNVIAQLNISATPKLSYVLASNNNLTTVTLAEEAAQLRQLFVDNNKLKKLDVAKATALEYLAADSNKLAEVALPHHTLYAYTCKDNALNFANLPEKAQMPTNFAYLPQETYIDIKNQLHRRRNEYFITMCPSYGEGKVEKYQIDLTNYAYDSGNRRVDVTPYAVVDGKPVELTKASASKPGDYYMISSAHGKIAFLKAYDEVYVEITSANYPDLKFETTHFQVYNPNSTGIDNVTTGAASTLEVYAENGRLVLEAAMAQSVSVYATSGKLVWKGQVADAPVTVQLPAGVYVVNGKKVVL